ncbi:MAG: T9SS type A sorting domain-containing protein [FCB group bacterium]|nr:T9SS type A sorting domain-containing protein [FCB group bacterium]
MKSNKLLVANLIMVIITLTGFCENIENLDQISFDYSKPLFIELNSNYLFVGQFLPYKMEVLDYTNALNPISVGSVSCPRTPVDCAFQDNYAYIAVKDSGFIIVDISDLSNMEIAGIMDTPGVVQGIAVSGDYAYLADHYSVRVVDISDVTQPVETGVCEGFVNINHIVKIGDFVYTCGSAHYVRSFDVSDPQNPFEVGVIDPSNHQIQDLDADDNYVYAPFGDGMRVVNVDDPANMYIMSICPEAGSSYEATVSGNLFADACGQIGVNLVDVSDPDNVFYINSFDVTGMGYGSDLYQDVLATEIYDGGIYLFDVSNPEVPVQNGDYLWGRALDVAVSGDYAFLASGIEGLKVIDISDPENLQEAAQLQLPGHAENIRIRDNYAFVATDASGLTVIDITIPTIPVMAVSLTIPGDVNFIEIDGDFAYLMCSLSDLRIIDISNPLSPNEIGYFDPADYDVRDIVINGNLAYVTTSDKKIITLDISNPASPYLVNELELDYFVKTLALCGDYLYSAGTITHSVLDCSNPQNLILLESFEYGGDCSDLKIYDNYLFASFGSVGLKIYNIEVPSYPVEVGNVNTSNSANSTVLAGDIAYVADWNAFRSYDCSEALNLSLVNIELSSGYSIYIPETGGDFDYWIIANNIGCLQATKDIWTEIEVPGFGMIPVFNHPDYQFPSFSTSSREFNQIVPRRAPAGDYTYYAYTGEFPDVIESMDSFEFTKFGFDYNFIYDPDDWICRENQPGLAEAGTNIADITRFNSAPNPFNNRSVVSFSLARGGMVRLKVFDITGREVRVLQATPLQAGYHEVVWDASGCGSGVYFVKLEAGDFNAVQKLLLIK